MIHFRILFVTSLSLDSTSSATIRNNNLIEGLLRQGNEVTVVCPEIKNKDVFNNKENIHFVTYKLNTTLSQIKERENISKNSFFRIIISKSLKLYRKFSILKLAGETLKCINQIDLSAYEFELVITSSDPIASHVFFSKIRHKVNYKKWCQYWGDPLANDVTNTTLIPKVFRKYYENSIISKADSIVYVSPFTFEQQKSIYPKLNKKMYFIPPASRDAMFYNRKTNDKMIISYSGGYNSIVRNILPLYNAVMKYTGEGVKLIISGTSDTELESNNKITINGKISSDHVAEIEESSDIIVIIMNKIGTQIPSKLYYTSSTNKDILVLVNSENDQTVKYISSFERFDICNNNEIDILNYLNNLNKSEIGNRKPLLSLIPETIANEFLKINM